MKKIILVFALSLELSCSTKNNPIQKERSVYENYEVILDYNIPYKSEYADSISESKHIKNNWYNLFVNENDTTYIWEYYECTTTGNNPMNPVTSLKMYCFNKKDIKAEKKWKLSYNEQLKTINSDYFTTFFKGCCGGEDAYSLFSTVSGKLIFKYTRIDTLSNVFIGYQSRNAMNSDCYNKPELVSGVISFFNKDGYSQEYTVECDYKIPLYNWTPDTKVISKRECNNIDLDFKYENGISFCNEEKDSIFYKITIADTNFIYIGITDHGLRYDKIISNIRYVSENFKLIKR